MALGLKSTLLSAVPGVSHGFFGATGGTSPKPWRGLNCGFQVGDAPARVEENLARVRFQIGVARRRLFTVAQVHGSTLIRIDGNSDLETVANENADALLTREQGFAVGVRTADCAPVLLAATDGRAVAAVHAGWRGAVGGAIEAALVSLEEIGVPARDVVAAVGPCIGQRAFEVGPEVVTAASARLDLSGLLEAGEGDRQHLDLAGLCLRILQAEGVTAESLGVCTFDDLDHEEEPLWYSYRRDGGRTGRQLSAIALADPPRLDPGTFA